MDAMDYGCLIYCDNILYCIIIHCQIRANPYPLIGIKSLFKCSIKVNLATYLKWTSSGPSAILKVRATAYALANIES